MFCPNCGNKLNGNEEFCSSCGNKVLEKSVNIANNTNATMTEMMAKKSSNFLKPIISSLKTFIIKYKKLLAICASSIVIVVLGIFLYNKFYDFTKINWDENFGDYYLEYSLPSQIKLKAEAFDKEDKEVTGIEYIVEYGTVEIKDEVAYWTLPTEAGKYTIVAKSPSGKKIEKDITVLDLNNEESNIVLGGLLEEDVDENTDSDLDGITNYKENEYGTDSYSADTDADGLLDKYEIEVSMTDPLKKDSDGDSLYDGDELDLDLDPLKNDSLGDGVNDGNRELTYSITDKDAGINIEINGKGNIASSTIDILKNSTLSDVNGLLDKVYNFYTDGTITSAIVKIKYDLNEIKAQGLNEDNLTLYYFNEDTKELEEINTVVDKENKEIIVTLNHFSKYVIGDKNVVITNNDTDVLFVIDNSVSMYTYEQLTNAGYTDITGADGNDSDFKRLSLTNKMIDMFTGNYNFGVSEFAGTYVNLKDFSSDKESVKTSVNSMNTNFHASTTGTNIVTALKSGISEFESDDNNHYLVLLTDGKNTSGSLSSNKNTIINSAKDKNVKVCIIGLGEEVDSDDLNDIAEGTGCDYYSASNASALDEIYAIMGADINYNMVDTDGDGKIDGMIIADSGFITSRDGFSFHNKGTKQSTGGNCYGMATFAMLRYTGKLPVSLEAKRINKFYSLSVGWIDYQSSGYDLTNTYFNTKLNLYDYKLQDEALKIYMYGYPSDVFDHVDGDVLYIKEKYKNLLENIGIELVNKEYPHEGPKYYQSYSYLDVENDKFIKNGNKEDVELFKAIWRLFMLQTNDKSVGFSGSPDKAFDNLVNNLENGNPVVLGIDGSNPSDDHAINAVRLIQDINDANKFKIEIYDNNYPGEIRYIEVNRSKYNKWQLNYTAWVNKYNYTFKYHDYDGNKNISVEISELVLD